MLALIDGDIIVYQAAFKAETIVDWGEDEDIISISGSKRETRDNIDSFVHDLKEVTGSNRVLLAFSDPTGNYFRKEVYPLYKSHRKSQRKPVTHAYGIEYAKQKYDSMTRPGLEADDVLGILSTGTIKKFPGPKVVCSIDKDMLTFPGLVYNWMHPDKGVVTVDEEDADLAFYTQTLMGDATDGYPGCPGLGVVRAKRLLEGRIEPDGGGWHQDLWNAVVLAYKKKGLTEEDALTQARCARILRTDDYDFSTKTPILWVPPTRGEEEDGTE